MTDLILPDPMKNLFTIGHSNHAAEHFAGLLRQHGIDVLIDVRSQPYSQYSPQFNREPLKQDVIALGIQYVFMGEELGGRPPEPAYYDAEGHVMYSKLAQSARFLRGIDRVEQDIPNHRVALMCSEENPAVCHRFLLVARVLADRGQTLQHIRGDGHINPQAPFVDEAPDPQMLLFPDAKEKPWRSLRPIASRPVRPSVGESAASNR